jgi:hypothetical protein
MRRISVDLRWPSATKKKSVVSAVTHNKRTWKQHLTMRSLFLASAALREAAVCATTTAASTVSLLGGLQLHGLKLLVAIDIL